MTLIIIAALNTKRVIGKNGKIPWHIPEDLKRFKALTAGHTVLMGRKTFESIGSPLPFRRNIVLSKNNSFRIPSDELHQNTTVEIFHSIASALTATQPDEKVFVIGGGEIFRQTIDRADEILLTIVDNNETGEVTFPEYDHLIGRSLQNTLTEHHSGYSFFSYKKTA
jgi:dihydrofolate reductase